MNTERRAPAGNADPSNTCTPEHRNRRKGPDRRKLDDPGYRGPERRRFGSRRLSDEIETLFVGLGNFLCRHSLAAIMVVLLVVVALTAMIPRLTVDTSSEALLHKDDPILLEYNQFRDRFGRSEMIIVAAEPRDVFSREFITWLDDLHTALAEEVPHIMDVTSLVTVRNTYGEGDVLVVEDLLEDWRDRRVDWVELRQRVLGNPFYVNNIVSADGKLAAVVLETVAAVDEVQSEADILESFEVMPAPGQGKEGARRYLSEKEYSEVVEAVKRIVERHKRPGINIAMSGGPFILEAFNRTVMQDLVRCLSISFGAVIVFLWVLFRRLSGVVMPLLIIVCSVLSTLGLMALFNVPIKITTTILPAFLVAVGVGDAVHILAMSGLIALAGTYYASQLEFSDYVVGYFPDAMAVKQDLKRIDEDLRGVITLEVVLDTQVENGVLDPESFAYRGRYGGDGAFRHSPGHDHPDDRQYRAGAGRGRHGSLHVQFPALLPEEGRCIPRQQGL